MEHRNVLRESLGKFYQIFAEKTFRVGVKGEVKVGFDERMKSYLMEMIDENQKGKLLTIKECEGGDYHRKIPHLSNASAMEYFDYYLYIVGDDAPFYYILDEGGEVIAQKPIEQTPHPHPYRMPSDKKADLECGVRIEVGDKQYFLALGSGSQSPQRDKGYVIPLNNPEDTEVIKELNLKPLYDNLRHHNNIKNLSLEAGITYKDSEDKSRIVLFNRGGQFQKNAIIFFSNPGGLHEKIKEAIKNRRDLDTEDVLPEAFDFDLPLIHGIAPGITGAAYCKTADILLYKPLFFC